MGLQELGLQGWVQCLLGNQQQQRPLLCTSQTTWMEDPEVWRGCLGWGCHACGEPTDSVLPFAQDTLSVDRLRVQSRAGDAGVGCKGQSAGVGVQGWGQMLTLTLQHRPPLLAKLSRVRLRATSWDQSGWGYTKQSKGGAVGKGGQGQVLRGRMEPQP